MIKVSVFYQNGKGITFDNDYYCNNHMVMVKEKMGDSCKQVTVDSGICGMEAGVDAPYIAIGHLYFESVEAFQTAFGPHANEILSDILNYTNAQPQIQISNVLL